MEGNSAPGPDRITLAQYKEMVADIEARKTAKPVRRRKVAGPAVKLPKPVRDASVVAVLTRILDHPALRNLRLAPEEQIAVSFAAELRKATLEGRLTAVWTHPANEIAGRRSGLSKIRYAIAKAMGLIYGTPDYVFLGADGSIALEAKVPGNKQQDNQKDFEIWCRCVGVPYHVFTSVEDGLSILEAAGFLTRDREIGRLTMEKWKARGAAGT